MKLYSYWRSSAAYRVRIALNLKNLAYELVTTHLARDEQHGSDYLQMNPQGLVPALEHDGQVFVQSLAIIEYLDSIADQPRLLPLQPVQRAHICAMAQAIACDIHPLNNLRVLNYLQSAMAQPPAAVEQWVVHWNHRTLGALEQWAVRYSSAGRYLFGDAVSLADVLLVPQLYNARRFAVGLDDYPTLVAIDAGLQNLPAFVAASPERQPDAVA